MRSYLTRLGYVNKVILFAELKGEQLERLATDLPYYISGLFPLFAFASMQIKPKIIDIVKVYFVPLEKDILPCLSTIVSSLVSGLEELNSEHYNSIVRVMDDLCIGVGAKPFYHSLWKTVYLNQTSRIGALHYLLDKLPKGSTDFDFDTFTPDHNVLVLNSLIAAIQDPAVLVQRTVLDLILAHFPVNLNLFDNSELPRLVKRLLLVQLRREISLNRRVYTWLLGPDESDHTYYQKYSKHLVVSSMSSLFQGQFEKIEEAVVPFKILLYLFDKPEISGPIINDLLPAVLSCLHMYKDGYSFSQEVISQVNNIVEGLKTEVVWSFICQFIRSDCASISKDGNLNSVEIIDTFLDKVHVSSKGHQTDFLVSLLEEIFRSGLELIEKRNSKELVNISRLGLKVVGKIIPFDEKEIGTSISECMSQFQQFFLTLYQNYLIPQLQVDTQREKELPHEARTGFKNSMSLICFDYVTQVLVGLYSQFKVEVSFREGTPKWVPLVLDGVNHENPVINCFSIRTFNDLSASQPHAFRSFLISNQYPIMFAKKLWNLLTPTLGHIHYKVVQLLLELKTMFNELCEDSIAEELLCTNIEKKVQNYQRFALLWRLSGEIGPSKNAFTKALFLMLDSLNDDQPLVRLAGRTWLADSIGKSDRIFDHLLFVLLDKTTLRVHNIYQQEYDCRRVLYAFKVLRSIVDCDFKLLMQHIIDKSISKEIQELLNAIQPNPSDQSPADEFSTISIENYLDIFVVESLRFIAGQPRPGSQQDFIVKNSMVQSTAANFLQYLLLKITSYPKASDIAKMLQGPVLESLAQAASNNNLMLQVNLLGLLRSIILIDVSRQHIGPKTEQGAVDAIGQSQMFQQTISIGLLQNNTDFNIRFYWLDFVTSCLPYMHSYLGNIVPSIVDCLCNIVNGYTNVYDSACCKDVLMLLKAIHIISAYILSISPKKNSINQREASSSFSSFFKNIFQIEGQERNNFEDRSGEAVRAILQKLPDLMATLIKLWGPPSIGQKSETGKKKLNSNTTGEDYYTVHETHNRYALQDQIVSILECFFDKAPSKFIVSMMSGWEYSPLGDTEYTENFKLSCIDILNTMGNIDGSSLVNAVLKIYQWSHQEDKTKSFRENQNTIKKRATNQAIHTHDPVILDFLYNYTEHTAKLTEITLNHYIGILKECHLSHNPHTLLVMFKVIDSFLNRFPKVISNLKNKKEIQGLIVRHLELLVSILNKSFLDLSESWRLNIKFTLHKATNFESDFQYIEDEEPEITAEDKANFHRKINISKQVIDLFIKYLLPILEKVFDDSRSGLSSAVTIVFQHVLPFLKGRHQDNPALLNSAVRLVQLFSESPALIDQRTWRKEISDLFIYSTSFFEITTTQLSSWLKIVNALFLPKDDSSAWYEFIKSLSRSLAITNFFYSGQVDMTIRALNFKKLAFIIFSGVKDQYLDQFPLIQEKLVEAIKIKDRQMVYESVFLCLRILILKINENALRSFWPVVVTEMIRIKDEHDPAMVLAVTKFLDLVFALKMEQFSAYDWIFVSEPYNHKNEKQSLFVPLIDRLSEGDLDIDEVFTDKPTLLTQFDSIPDTKDSIEYHKLLRWLSKYSRLQYKNRIGTSEPANMDDIEADILKEFTELEREYSKSSGENSLSIL